MENNIILKIQAGSHLYGTNTPTSDIDYSGIAIADEDYYFGMKSIDELDLSTISKLESGRNTSDAIDFKLYEIRNFARLASQNNPNILEHLFVNENNILHINNYGEMLLKNSHIFPHKGAYDRFIGYASSQRHKMLIKLENYEELLKAKEFFSKENPNEYIVMFRESDIVKKFFKEKGSHFIIGDLNFQKHLMVKKVLSAINDRMSKITNRNSLVLKYGFDVKFASHLIRLLLEGGDLLKYGKIVYPLSYAPLLLDIKNGKYSLDDILLMSEKYESEMKEHLNHSTLPDSPRIDEINNLVKKITKSFYKNKI